MKIVCLFVLVIAVFEGVAGYAQICGKSYDHVSAEVLSCFRTTGPQHGILLTGGNSGNISAPGGGSGIYSWSNAGSLLSLEVTHLPFWAKCGDAVREFDDFVNACRETDTVTHLSSSKDSDVWRVDSPNVLQPETVYPQIRFASADKVEVEAGGCAQTGGHGNTWRLYVNPSNDPLHHGLIRLPGLASPKKIKEVMGAEHAVTLPSPITGDNALRLGFESSDFTAGGYWGRDPGPNNECVGQPNAFVIITVTHSSAH